MAQPADEAPATVTVQHVALAAGVSRQTVSRVLNEHPCVAPATRDRVRAAMAQLRWSPDPAARALGRRSALRPVPRGVAEVIAELQATGFRVVDVPAGATPEQLARAVALEGCRGVVVRVV